MKRELSREILKLGVPVRLRDIEAELYELHADFPEFFLSVTPPQLLRPESRNGTASDEAPAVRGPRGPYKKHKKPSTQTRHGMPRKPGGATEQALAKRARSKAILDFIQANGPLQVGSTLSALSGAVTGYHASMLAPLVRRGYVRMGPKGYIRTGREYVVDPTAK